MDKKLCYALLYTGDNEKILARTILFYERLKKIVKNDIFFLTENKNNISKLKQFVDENFIYVPENPEKYSFSKMKRYPNIYMKFCIYELNKFGYTHCVYLDADVFINQDFVKTITTYERYITNNIFGFAVQRYSEKAPDKIGVIYMAFCIIANIEKDLSDVFLSYDGKKECQSADEDLIDLYSLDYPENMQDIPGGFITSSPLLKNVSLMFHTGGTMWATALASKKDKSDFERYTEIKNILEKSKNSTLLF